MPEIKFTRLAESDLASIDEYTADRWGADQADLYLDQMRSFCTLLAGTPRMGRPFGPQRSGIRRIEQGSHIIFYRETPLGILITPILHRSMLPERQPLDDPKSEQNR